MTISRPFAFNTGTTISGTTQIGNIAIGIDDQDYSTNPGGVIWNMGPDEELGDIIGIPTIEGNSIEFYRTSGRTSSGYTITEQYVLISNIISSRRGYTGFTNTVDAKAYIDTIGFTTFTGATFEPEALSYFDRMTGGTPDNTLKEIINICIRNLKTTGVWDHIDVIRFANLHTQQASLLNVKTADFGNGINVNNLAWYAGRGFIGTNNADGKRIDSNFSPSTQGINYTRDDAFFGAYTADYEITLGTTYYTQFLNALTSLCPKSGSGSSYRPRCFTHNTATVNQNPPSSSQGLTIATRVLSTSCGWYKDGVAKDGDADNSTEIPAGTFGELGGGSFSYGAFVKNMVYGGGMSAQNHVDLYNILTDFNNSVTRTTNLISNSNFDLGGTGWSTVGSATFDYTNGYADIYGPTWGSIYQGGFVIGKYYMATFTYTSSGGCTVGLASSAGEKQYWSGTATGPTTITTYFTATTTYLHFSKYSTTNVHITFDNISVIQII